MLHFGGIFSVAIQHNLFHLLLHDLHENVRHHVALDGERNVLYPDLIELLLYVDKAWIVMTSQCFGAALSWIGVLVFFLGSALSLLVDSRDWSLGMRIDGRGCRGWS